MHLGQRLRQARVAVGITQQEVADRVGVTRGAVAAWESGQIKQLRSDNLRAVCKLYGVTTDEMVGRVPEAGQLSSLATQVAHDFDQLDDEQKELILHTLRVLRGQAEP